MFADILLPLRNVARNRRRTLITLITTAVGCIALLIFGGYAAAVVHGVETGVVRQAGHLQVQRKNYFLVGTGDPGNFGIADYKSLMHIIENDRVVKPNLRVITPILQLQGIAGNFENGVSRTISGYGYIPHDQNVMRTWNEYRFPDRPRAVPIPEGASDVVSVGIGVARNLHLCSALNEVRCKDVDLPARKTGPAAPADIVALAKSEPPPPQRPGVHIDLLAATANGAPNVVNARVIGAESLGIKEIDDTYLAMPLSLAQQLVYGHGSRPQVTALELQLKRSAQIETVTRRLNELIRSNGWDLEVLDYATLYPAYKQIKGLFASIFGFVATLIGVVVLFSVANTMGSAVMERTVEIGTLRSMGVSRFGIAGQFLTEGLLIGVIGTGVGTVLALLCAWVINTSGLTWTPPNSIDAIPLVVHTFNSPWLIVGTIAALVILAALSSVLPAVRAARLPVVEALRHV